jgi:hypothetical protein
MKSCETQLKVSHQTNTSLQNMAATSISASFLAADKLRLDIEHRLIALDQESSTLSNPALRTDEKDRIFQQLSEHETQCFNAINDFQRIVREVEDLVEKEVSHRRDMWREYVSFCNLVSVLFSIAKC